MNAAPLRIATLTLGLVAVSACGRAAPTPPHATGGHRPGIVVIVVDTLRADAVPLSVAEDTRLPSLRTFAKGATAFADAVAPAAWTPQSMASILTGLSPLHTGCQGTAETSVPDLPGAIVTLAERLRAAGYATSAVTGGGFLLGGQSLSNTRSGSVPLLVGEADPPPRRPRHEASPSSAPEGRRQRARADSWARTEGIAQGFESFEAGFDVLGPEAGVWTWSRRRDQGSPFFLLLHTYVAHDPYGKKDARAIASFAPPTVPPSPTLLRTLGASTAATRPPFDAPTLRACAYEWFLDGPARPANSRLVLGGQAQDFIRALRGWQEGGYLADPDGRAPIEARFRAAYQEGLASTDEVLSRTFTALSAAKLPPDTIIVVTSDHGEAHGEHGFLLHELHLHDEIVRVPLLIRAPGRMPEGSVVHGTCGPIDLTPTLLELAGIPASEGGLDGRSLLSLANGREGGHPIVSTADRVETLGAHPRAVREVTVRDEWRRWCYVYDVETGEVVAEHGFDLATDPRALAPRPVGSLGWDDPAFCRLVSTTRDEVRAGFGLPSSDPPGALLR